MLTQSALQYCQIFTQSCTHSLTDGGVDHAGQQSGAVRVRLLAQGHLNTLIGGNGVRPSNLTVTSQPALPPEPATLPLMSTTLPIQGKMLLSPPSFNADLGLSLRQSIESLSPNVASVRDLYQHPDGVLDNVLYQRNWLLTSGVEPRIHKGIQSRDFTGTVAYHAGNSETDSVVRGCSYQGRRRKDLHTWLTRQNGFVCPNESIKVRNHDPNRPRLSLKKKISIGHNWGVSDVVYHLICSSESFTFNCSVVSFEAGKAGTFFFFLQEKSLSENISVLLFGSDFLNPNWRYVFTAVIYFIHPHVCEES